MPTDSVRRHSDKSAEGSDKSALVSELVTHSNATTSHLLTNRKVCISELVTISNASTSHLLTIEVCVGELVTISGTSTSHLLTINKVCVE